MINYQYEYLFNQTSVNKQLIITTSGATITNESIHSESMRIHESLNSSDELIFGSCESSCFEIEIENVVPFSLVGREISVQMILDGHTEAPFQIGFYTVYEDVLTAGRKRRKITAYDALYKINNAEVSGWYNSLTFPMTLRAFRNSFANHMGVTQDNVVLQNDAMTVEETIAPSDLSGTDVLNCICEINGCFAHIGRNGHLQYKILEEASQGLYPSPTLYPKDDLYPASATAIEHNLSGFYIRAEYEDYKVKRIDKLQIRQSENDIGAIAGTGTNAYIVEDNFLVYGKGANELAQIANNLFVVIRQAIYQPCKIEAVGNLCLECGDLIRVSTSESIIHTYILEREIRGIQTLFDTIYAEGYPQRLEEVNSLNHDIIQLRGKTNELVRNVEETVSMITDVESGLSSRITQTATAISTEVTRATKAEGTLTSQINQTATSIEAKVSKTGGNASSFGWSLESDKFELKSSNKTVFKCDSTGIEVNGKITATSGYIGSTQGFTINSTAIYNGTNSLTSVLDGIYIGTDGINLGGKKFVVKKDGTLTATKGNIGGFTITDKSIYSGKSSVGSDSSDGVYIGTDGINVGRYGLKVTSGGDVTIGSASNRNTLTLNGDLAFPTAFNGYIKKGGSEIITFTSTQTHMKGAGGFVFESEVQFDARMILGKDQSAKLNGHSFTLDAGGTTSTTRTVLGYNTSTGNVSVGTGTTGVMIGTTTSKLHFFGASGSTKTTVANKTYSTTTTANAVGNDLNALKTALRNYGLIG